LNELVEWKNSEGRKPLILEGARQVGKTWLMREFGKAHFEDVAEFNFDENEELKSLFKSTKNPEILLERLSIIHGKAIQPQKTLIIFDEIQECPQALNALKYFKEKAPQYAVISAGSLLGVYLAKGHSHPVGQVNIMQIYPMSFEEFLLALAPNMHTLYTQIKKGDMIEEIFHTRFIELYQTYLIVGGLPECVKVWRDTKDISALSQKMNELIAIYERDFSKHNSSINAARILMVFRNIAAQLSKENNKFVYSDIGKGARARNFEEAIEWLVTSGMINRVYLTKKNEMPLNVYKDLSAFKLYLFDTGLLKHMAGIPNEYIILNKDFQFKGALTENFVVQEINSNWAVAGASRTSLNYFTFGRYEIDFMFQDKSGNIIPIEVKSGKNTSSVSFSAYNEKYNPKQRIRYSLLNYKIDSNITNIPLYLCGKTKELI